MKFVFKCISLKYTWPNIKAEMMDRKYQVYFSLHSVALINGFPTDLELNQSN